MAKTITFQDSDTHKPFLYYIQMFFNYRIYSSTHDDFSKNVSGLFDAVSDKDRVLTISIFGFSETINYRSQLEIIQHIANQKFGRMPLLSFIAQSPENRHTIVAEVCYLSEKIGTEVVSYNQIDGNNYLIVKTRNFSALFIEGIMADDLNKSIAEQSSSVFGKIGRIMQAASMPVSNIVRQWNYIGQITSEENDRQNYQEFNNERARFYKETVWENGYPAATGISMNINALIVSLIAVEFHNETQVHAIDNSLQLAAHRYSESVLGKSGEKETPKFERAKLIVNRQSAYCFISGTAAILGEKSLGSDTVETQTSQTIALIRHLISSENLKLNYIDLSENLQLIQLRVYVKQEIHFDTIRELVETELPGINIFFVCAPVCRDELLVEIEGIAVTGVIT